MRYVALLRGIMPMNPNMHPDKLKGAFERMGFKKVQTVIASGNVVFDSPSKSIERLEKKIEEALPDILGFKSATLVRSKEHLEAILRQNPFGKAANNPKLYPLVTFIKESKAEKPFKKTGGGYKWFAEDKGELYTAVVKASAKAPDFMTTLEKHYGKKITSRTWKTVGRIVQAMGK